MFFFIKKIYLYNNKVQNILKGLNKLILNKEKLNSDLELYLK